MKSIKSLLIICLCLLATSAVYAQGLFQSPTQETTTGNVEGSSSSLFSPNEGSADFSLRSGDPMAPPPTPGEENYVGKDTPIGDGLWIVAMGVACYIMILIRNREKKQKLAC